MPFVASLIALFLKPGENLQATAQRLIAEQRKAGLRKDHGYMERTFASDFFAINIYGQRHSREVAIAAQKRFLARFDLKTETTRILRVVPAKDGMTVTIEGDAVGVVKAPKSGRAYSMAIHGQSAETWRRTGEVWKIHEIVTQKESIKVNGKSYAIPSVPR